jgi:hypothetical protein
MSAIELAKLRTQAAYVEGPSGRLEIIADFGSQRLAFTEPGTESNLAPSVHTTYVAQNGVPARCP